jgi:hypothetical protein
VHGGAPVALSIVIGPGLTVRLRDGIPGSGSLIPRSGGAVASAGREVTQISRGDRCPNPVLPRCGRVITLHSKNVAAADRLG